MKNSLLYTCFMICIVFSRGAEPVPYFVKNFLPLACLYRSCGLKPNEYCPSDDAGDCSGFDFKGYFSSGNERVDLKVSEYNSCNNSPVGSFKFEDNEFNTSEKALNLESDTNSDVEQECDESTFVRCIHFMMEEKSNLAEMLDDAKAIKIQWERIIDGRNGKNPNVCTHKMNGMACRCHEEK